MTIDPLTTIMVQEHPECVVVNFLPDTLLDPDVIDRTGSAIDQLVASGHPPRIVLSMPNVHQISSMMISVLIRASKGCQAKGGAAKLANLSRRVDQILEMAALKPIFEIYPTDEAARASF